MWIPRTIYGENELIVNPTSLFNLFHNLRIYLELTLKGVDESAF